MSKRLGTLTLDLVAKIGKFTQPIEKADKKLDFSLKNMRKNANKFGKTFAGVATTVVASSVAIVESQVNMAKEIQRNARLAGAGVEEFQKYAEASKHVGVESEQLADMLKDVQEKFGEFAATGGGGAADFFKDIAPKIGVTIEQFQRLSGPEALQLYKDSLDKAGVSQKQQIFYLESLSSDTSKLIPLLAQSGKGFDVYSESIMRHGGIMSKEAIAKAQVFDAVQEDLNNQLKGLKNTVAEALLPSFIELANQFSNTTNEASGLQVIGDAVAFTIKGISQVVIGAVTAFKLLGTAIGGIAYIKQQLLTGNFTGALATAKSLASDLDQIMQTAGDSINRLRNDEVKVNQTLQNRINLQRQIDTSQTASANRALRLGKEQSKIYQKQNRLLKQKNKHIKALRVNQTVLNHAQKYNYAGLEKKYGLPAGLLSAVSMQESRGNPNKTSHTGAKGEFQFMPATARRYGIQGQERNTRLAAEASAKYLNFQLKTFGDLNKAIAGYNAGEGNVKKYRGIPPFKETQKYVKRVRAYLAFMQGGTDGNTSINSILNSQSDTFREQQQLIEQQKALRLKHEKEAADEITRINIELGEKIREIESANHDPIRAKQLIEIEKGKAKEQIQGIKDAQTASDQAFQRQLANLNRYKTTQKQLINDNFQAQRDSLELERDLTDKQKELKLKAINEAEQYQLDKFNAREQYQLSKLNASHKTALQRIEDEFNYRRQMLTLNNNYSPEFKVKALDALNSQEDKARENVQVKAQAGFERQGAELNGTSQVFGLDKQLAEQKKIANEALEAEVITKEEHNQRLIMLDKQYWANKNQLYISQGQSVVGSMTNILGTLVGKNSKAYRVMFAIEKGMAIARSVIAIQTGIAQAAANPFPMNLSAMASVATATASIISNLQAVRQPNLAGQAHSGLDYVPREGTYLLDKGEAVIKPRQNARLQSFLDKQEKGNNQPPNITVINNGEPVKVDSVQMTENDVRIIISKEVPRLINDSNSKTSKALKNNIKAVRRLSA